MTLAATFGPLYSSHLSSEDSKEVICTEGTVLSAWTYLGFHLGFQDLFLKEVGSSQRPGPRISVCLCKCGTLKLLPFAFPVL